MSGAGLNPFETHGPRERAFNQPTHLASNLSVRSAAGDPSSEGLAEDWGVVVEFLVSGLVDASIILFGAIGLSLLYGVKRFANFAHGDMMTLGAYIAFYFAVSSRGNLIVGLLASIVIMAVLGVVLEILIFARLEGKGPIAPLIAAVGLSFVLQNLVGFIFGGTDRVYPGQLMDNWIIGPFSINPIRDFIPLVAGFSAAIGILLLLRFTKLGKAMRAMADNPELARTSGVNTRSVTFATWALSSGFAAAGGVMLGVNQGLSLQMGFQVLLLLFSAVILGGIGSVPGSIVGALAIGFADALFFPIAIAANIPTGWYLTVPFGLMVIMLILRPAGLLGRTIGREERPFLTYMRESLRGFRRRAV